MGSGMHAGFISEIEFVPVADYQVFPELSAYGQSHHHVASEEGGNPVLVDLSAQEAEFKEGRNAREDIDPESRF